MSKCLGRGYALRDRRLFILDYDCVTRACACGPHARRENDQEAEIVTLPLPPGTKTLIGFPPFG
jgi:hypothetical protein